jgi:hypothetical protein
MRARRARRQGEELTCADREGAEEKQERDELYECNRISHLAGRVKFLALETVLRTLLEYGGTSWWCRPRDVVGGRPIRAKRICHPLNPIH